MTLMFEPPPKAFPIEGHSAAVEIRIRLTLKVPISLTADIRRPLIRLHDLRQVIAASFHKEHTNPAILGEATGDD